MHKAKSTYQCNFLHKVAKITSFALNRTRDIVLKFLLWKPSGHKNYRKLLVYSEVLSAGGVSAVTCYLKLTWHLIGLYLRTQI